MKPHRRPESQITSRLNGTGETTTPRAAQAIKLQITRWVRCGASGSSRDSEAGIVTEGSSESTNVGWSLGVRRSSAGALFMLGESIFIRILLGLKAQRLQPQQGRHGATRFRFRRDPLLLWRRCAPALPPSTTGTGSNTHLPAGANARPAPVRVDVLLLIALESRP
ncbi:hypothetical protein D9619_013459 [Psilocybe cf. subviscida]|uniref:Uncharacterized protein n=1 Tax=Psilocybe cf. subviscida TaxID=2480587 RepID=A0A8H5BS13_9AGAR|nr:hypothetical protein D9619_013459 [Psilocybe cf. subviscida]